MRQWPDWSPLLIACLLTVKIGFDSTKNEKYVDPDEPAKINLVEELNSPIVTVTSGDSLSFEVIRDYLAK